MSVFVFAQPDMNYFLIRVNKKNVTLSSTKGDINILSGASLKYKERGTMIYVLHLKEQLYFFIN